MKTLILSDLHIGSKGCKTKEILQLLKDKTYERYILVGDIIDGWLFPKYQSFTNDQTKIIRKFLKLSKKREIIWIAGNHDEFLRKYLPMQIGKIKIVNEFIENGIFFCHGDEYDGIVKMKWLGKLGSYGYDIAIVLDRFFKKLGIKKSLSSFLKNNVKAAISFMVDFENEMVRQAIKRNCKTVICGHIHHPSDKIINDVRYLNSGDFIENCSYIEYYSENKNLILIEKFINHNTMQE